MFDFSRETKKLFEKIGTKTNKDLSKCKVVASNDINEEALIDLNSKVEN